MTQLESARKGETTPEMVVAAAHDHVSPEELRQRVAAGSVVIPKNRLHAFEARAIGQGLSTKINANIGTSASHASLPEELDKLSVAIEAGADAVMDLSTGGDIDAILAGMIEHSSVMIGTVPIYRSVSRLFAGGLTCKDLTEDAIFADIEHEARMGVDFMTLHCGISTRTLAVLEKTDRIMGIVSRGGSLMAEWMKLHRKENPLYEHYDRLLDIARKYDVTLVPGRRAQAGDDLRRGGPGADGGADRSGGTGRQGQAGGGPGDGGGAGPCPPQAHRRGHADAETDLQRRPVLRPGAAPHGHRPRLRPHRRGDRRGDRRRKRRRFPLLCHPGRTPGASHGQGRLRGGDRLVHRSPHRRYREGGRGRVGEKREHVPGPAALRLGRRCSSSPSIRSRPDGSAA